MYVEIHSLEVALLFQSGRGMLNDPTWIQTAWDREVWIYQQKSRPCYELLFLKLYLL